MEADFEDETMQSLRELFCSLVSIGKVQGEDEAPKGLFRCLLYLPDLILSMCRAFPLGLQILLTSDFIWIKIFLDFLGGEGHGLCKVGALS